MKYTRLIKILTAAFSCSLINAVDAYPSDLNAPGRITKVKVTNQIEIERKDEIVSIPVDKLKSINPEFNENAFTVFDGNLELPSQTDDIDGDGKAENIIILANFNQKESKTLIIESDKTAVLKRGYKKRTHAEISEKVNYKRENGIYSGGMFQSVKETKVPQDHFAHDALYKFEGPGWESDKIAYRLYLDSRNRNDIFGKITDKIVLPEVGQNDLVSDSKESYTKMCGWGMDIFKVGESLGIGSIGMIRNGKVNAVSKTDKIICKITTDGPIRSDILTDYQNWQIENQKYNLTSLLSINAGSRLTETKLNITGNPENICTGIAKHSGCVFIKDTNNYSWSYIATYGKQSLAGDNLGLVIFFKKSALINTTEDDASYLVVLKPSESKLNYYFGAAWEKERNGIKSKEEFLKYLDEEANKLSNSLIVEY